MLKNSYNTSDLNQLYKNSLTEADLEKIARFIYQRSGIVLNGQKKDMVFNRLTRRLKSLGLASFSEYISLLESDPSGPEWQSFINSLTTNLTSFFREAHHFPILARHAKSRRGSYSVWCAAASTGEEPWSIAITLEETLGKNISGPRVWASDIDTDVLNKARQGLYRLVDIHTLTEEQKKRWFLRRTENQHVHVKVKKELMSCVNFRQLNLMEAKWDVPAPFDAIFCRNVLIYFDKKTQEIIINRFSKMLKPGGLLFVGHSEHFGNTFGPFRLQGQSVYALTSE